MRRSLARALVVVAAVVAAMVAVPALVPSLNPFREEERDRSEPVVVQSLEDLSEYRAATANLQVIVDLERDARLLPSFIKGERTLFVAVGSVDAAVDPSGIGQDAIELADDGGADQQRLYGVADDKLRAAAAADPRLLETARRNTRTMLTGLMRGLGFERITVRFRQADT